MKRLLLLSVALLACTTPAEAMQIGEIARFDNRRPALGRFKVESDVLQDFNRDGTFDISAIEGCELKVYSGETQIVVWNWDFDNDEIPLKSACAQGMDIADLVTVLGYLCFDEARCGDSIVEYVWFAFQWDLNDDGIDNTFTAIVNTTSKQIEYIAEARPVAAIQLPSSGKLAVIMAIEKLERGIVIIGETGGNSAAASIASDGGSKLPGFSGSYQLGLKFQADPGWRLAYDPDLFDPRHDMDIDGDEHMDIPMIIQDDNNESIGVVVRGGDNFDVLWQFPFPKEHKENILKGFFGFVDANGDGEKEAILGENLAVTLDGTVYTIAENFVTLDVNDVDGDGYEDIIGLNTTDSTIVVYGAMTATSVESYDPAEIHFRLFQNYPNPFNPSTTIAYSVAQPSTVELTVYNLLGQAVRTLFRGQQGAGNYSLTWDGTDDGGRLVGSGPYFYRMKVGQTIRTQSMLFLK